MEKLYTKNQNGESESRMIGENYAVKEKCGKK